MSIPKTSQNPDVSGGFVWDKGNQTKNIEKHGVRNEEAEQVFFNNPAIFDDKRHSRKGEKRFFAYGRTNSNRLLTVVFTIRDKRVRIISARPMGKREQGDYLQ
jgi:uncharacterized DUF497 family protein